MLYNILVIARVRFFGGRPSDRTVFGALSLTLCALVITNFGKGIGSFVVESLSETVAKRKLKNDVIFIVAVMLAVIIFGLCYFLMRGEGDVVVVTVDGELYGEYPLDVDTVVEIRSGDGVNVLVIRDGEAHVEEASCPDGICSQHKPISKSKESIVCLPNKVVISVRRSTPDDSPDIIL